MITRTSAYFFALITLIACVFAAAYSLTSSPRPGDQEAYLGNWDQIMILPDYSQSSQRIASEFGGLNLFGAPAEPAPDAVVTDEENVESIPDFRLVGLAEIDGSTIALLDDGDGFPERVRPGSETKTGWQLVQIGRSSVLLEKGDQQTQVSFFGKAESAPE